MGTNFTYVAPFCLLFFFPPPPNASGEVNVEPTSRERERERECRLLSLLARTSRWENDFREGRGCVLRKNSSFTLSPVSTNHHRTQHRNALRQTIPTRSAVVANARNAATAHHHRSRITRMSTLNTPPRLSHTHNTPASPSNKHTTLSAPHYASKGKHR